MSLSAPSPAPPARTVSVTVFVVALLVVAGVAIAVTAAYYEIRPAPALAGSVSITDDVGRQVAVPVDPARVVELAPNIMDSLDRLGLRSHVVGVDCGTPADGGLATDYNASQIALWNLSASMCVETSPSLDIPQVLNFSPQLVLASTITSVSDVEELSSTYGIPVVILAPSTLGGILVDVTLLGEIFNVPQAADRLVAQLQGSLGTAAATVANDTSAGGPLPSVLLTYYADAAAGPSPGYWTYGPNSFGQSLIEFVGGASIAASSPFPYVLLSGDQVLNASPSIIIYGTGFGVTLSTYQQGPDWSDLSAVQSDHIYGIDSNYLTEADPTMILVTVPLMVSILYPASG